jgi:ribosomal protein S27AE
MKSRDPSASVKAGDIVVPDGNVDRPDSDETICPRCGESHDLAKVKGCIKCLKCGFKFDCNGW